MASINCINRYAMFSVVVVVLASCSSTTAQPPPTRFEATLTAAAGINLDAQGRPSPLVVRVYELASDSVFKTADFFDLYDKESAVLTGMLVKRDEFTMMPHGNVSIERKLQPSTRFVGVVGAFRNIDDASWRAVVPVTAHKTNGFTIHLTPAGIVMKPIAEEAPAPEQQVNPKKLIDSLLSSFSFAADDRHGGTDGLE